MGGLIQIVGIQIFKSHIKRVILLLALYFILFFILDLSYQIYLCRTIKMQLMCCTSKIKTWKLNVTLWFTYFVLFCFIFIIKKSKTYRHALVNLLICLKYNLI